MIFDYLFLPVLFFIGLITSYQDFHCGKIKNKWIFLGFIWGAGILAASFLWGLAEPLVIKIFGYSPIIILSGYMLNVAINAVISLIIGYLLWHFDTWSAGDAKLFFVFSLLLPLKYYQRSVFPYFPSIVLLVNTFLPVVVFLAINNIYFFSKKALIFFKRGGQINFKKIIKQGLDLLNKKKTETIKMLFIIFLISFGFQLLRSKFDFAGSNKGSWLAIIFLLLSQILGRLSKFFVRKPVILFLVLAGVLSIFWAGPSFLLGEFIKGAPLLMSSLIFMPAFLIVSVLLTKLPGQNKERKLAFALWLFIGVLITIALKGSIISFFIKR